MRPLASKSALRSVAPGLAWQAASKLEREEGARMLDLARDTSAARYRELHGFTYGDPDSVWEIEAGRGVRFYLSGLVAGHRLPLRAYHGATIWKNGIPIGYFEALSLCERMEAGFNLYYTFREAFPAPVIDHLKLYWTAWLMPDRETQLDPKLRRQCDEFSGKLVHPMVDDPRVGRFSNGKQAEWNQGDTYYKKTGDWRGNKSYYRSGFTREMSTANFNSSASSGALLNGQIIGSKHAMADGRAGLMQFPFWMWTHSAGVGQEYIDHYYWAIATAANKNFADFCQEPEDRMAGWSIVAKTVNDLAGAYHPNLKKLLGPASRTYYEHVLGRQDGLYHILHVLSPQGALCDVDSGVLPAITATRDGKPSRSISAWGHDYPPALVAQQSLSGPWADPWFAELVDEKPFPWTLYVEKEGDPVCTYFGENYGLSCIRQKPQRLHMLGHWRRKPALPTSMRDIGTLEIRIGFNQTTIGCDGEGVISQQGIYKCYASANKLVVLARPKPEVIAQQAGEHAFGQKKLPAQPITSVQCSAALFNFELPAPTWQIFVDDRKIDGLPATAKFGQIVTIRDGVSYLALRPLPTNDLGRDAEITLEAGQPQTQAYHEDSNIQPALFVHANFYRRDAGLAKADLEKLKGASSGFVVEMSDEREDGSFEQFRKRVLASTLSGEKGAVTYVSGKDTLAASWEAFAVNGTDPCAYAREKRLWQDTTLTQMGRARLEKNGAVIERGQRHPELNLFLQTFPKQKRYVAMNLLPNHIDYRFSEPGGVKIVADGACSMGRWSVMDSNRIDILYHAFGAPYAPKDRSESATVLFVSGVRERPQVTLNGKDVSGALKAWQQNGSDGWLVSLTGEFLKDEEIRARLDAAAK